MSNHKITLGQIGKHLHFARCTCAWKSGSWESKQTVEDDIRRHMKQVDIVRAYLSTSTPSLKAQRDYYLYKVNDPTVEPRDRLLWQQLADELSNRVGDRPQTEQYNLELNPIQLTQENT